MSDLLQAIQILKATFDKYATEEGDKKTMTKKELVKMVRNEITEVDPGDHVKMDEFLKILDNNSDGVVDFTEYITYVGALAIMIKDLNIK